MPTTAPLRVLPMLAGAVLAAQTPSWSPDWAVAGLGGTVFAFADHGGQLFAGGEWFASKGGVIRGLAHFDGTDWQPVGTGIDLVNYSFPPRDTQVSAMTVFNGELVFAGTFDQVDGQPRNYIARWNGTTFASLGSGLELSYDEADVRALAVFNNELYAAGQFDTAGGIPVNGIARWNGTVWSPVGAGLRLTGGASVGHARALHVHQGALIAAGQFGLAGNVAAQNIARWNGSTWSPLGQGSLATVYALESYGTQLVAAGQFQVGGQVAIPGAWNGSTWSGLGSNAPGVPSVAVRAFGTDLYLDSGGALSRWNGSTWSNAGVVAGIFNGTQGTSIRALHVHGSELMVGGQFTRAGNAPPNLEVASANVVAYDGGTGWRTLGTGNGLGHRTNRLLPWRGGWIAAGPFDEAGGTPATGLAFFDGDTWQMVGRMTGGGGQAVYDAAIHQDGVVVSGGFTHIDGVPFPGIARFDGVAWQPFGTLAPYGLCARGNELYGFGSTALQRWNGSAFVIAATPTTGGIDALHVHSDGFLYALNNDAFNHRVLRWNGTALQSIGVANDFLHALGSRGSELVVGGRFTAVGGAPAALIARWNGTTWGAMPAPVSGYAAYSFCELDGDFYAGVSGDPRGMTLRLRNGAWSGLGSGTEGVPTMLFADRAVGSVFASGEIILAAGLPTRNLAEWRTQPDWRNRLHGSPGATNAPLLLGRGNVQAGATITWTMQAASLAVGVLVVGLQRVDVPTFGGVLVPSPDVLVLITADPSGTATLAWTLPVGVTAGIDVFSQAWLPDATAPQGLAATNALQCRTH